jgi:hypothetical protein
MARRLAAAAIGVVLLGAGCGGHGASRADLVARYIDDVNAIQRKLAVPLAEVSRQNRALRTGTKFEVLRPKLERSAGTIRMLERRLDALEPPAEATRLDALVRELVHDEWELAHEFALLARYAPAAGPVLERATAAGKDVRTELRATRKPAAQADALDAYAAKLDAVVERLGQLQPPPVVEVERRSQIRTYTRIAASARALADVLREGKDAARALHRLEVALVSGSTISAQRARIEGLRAFNRRVTRVKRLASSAQRERTRLQRSLR